MNAPELILAYLAEQMPDYPFNPDIDTAFVAELIDDFADLDLLEEAKTFRWYYNNQPAARYRNLRLGLRRWIANAWARRND